MSLNLDSLYISNLKRYVGKELKIIQDKNNIEIIQDNELQYSLEKKIDNSYSFFYIERGKRIEIAQYSSELEMKRKFAIVIRGLIGKKISYENGDEFENAQNIIEVERLMGLYIGKEYYSIMNPQKMKINLEFNNNNRYSIYLLEQNGDKIYKEQNEEPPFIFFRFYSEALFYKVMTERINSYEIIFDDILTNQEKYDLMSV
ncbi:hypothetical protein E5347_14935 [Clostridium sartagoforme]|uniref:Uncharacterized protein n=1 Tax=Clostridium sartagoforme TaxID=84031 RepID=A0A4S2DF69_9CLOT|nr:hypothetical protein [Clostridium sartagoforme]TGY40637.1 hypothetical protein E5347_14935 [Clostridium sartagoforme]